MKEDAPYDPLTSKLHLGEELGTTHLTSQEQAVVEFAQDLGAHAGAYVNALRQAGMAPGAGPYSVVIVVDQSISPFVDPEVQVAGGVGDLLRELELVPKPEIFKVGP